MRANEAWHIFGKRPCRICAIGITMWSFLFNMVLADISLSWSNEVISPPSSIEPIARVENARENPIVIDSKNNKNMDNEFKGDFYLRYLNDIIVEALESGSSIAKLKRDIEKLGWAREICGLECELRISGKEDGFYIKYVKDSRGTVGIVHYFLKEAHATTGSYSVLPLNTGKTVYYEPISEESYDEVQKHVVSVAFSTNDGCEKHIMEAIELADNKIDIAIYNFDNKRILDALLAAGKKRKVAVRIMVDKSSIKKIKKMIDNDRLKDKEVIKYLEERGIELKVDKRKDGLMHNKFMVVDNKLVLTGSYNWTEHSNSNRENTVMLSYIAAFQEYFDWLWSGKTRSPPTTRPPPFGLIALFSPKGGCYNEVMRLITEAAAVKKAHPERPQNIDIALFYFTDKRIAEALFGATEAGVNIRIVLDKGQKNLSYSIEKYLVSLEEKARKKNPKNPGRGSFTIRYYRIENGLMHNKFAIIGRNTLTGSFNWSKRADDRNRENLVIMTFLVKAYSDEFERLWKDFESEKIISTAPAQGAPPGPPPPPPDEYKIWIYNPLPHAHAHPPHHTKKDDEEEKDDAYKRLKEKIKTFIKKHFPSLSF